MMKIKIEPRKVVIKKPPYGGFFITTVNNCKTHKPVLTKFEIAIAVWCKTLIG